MSGREANRSFNTIVSPIGSFGVMRDYRAPNVSRTAISSAGDRTKFRSTFNQRERSNRVLTRESRIGNSVERSLEYFFFP